MEKERENNNRPPQYVKEQASWVLKNHPSSRTETKFINQTTTKQTNSNYRATAAVHRWATSAISARKNQPKERVRPRRTQGGERRNASVKTAGAEDQRSQVNQLARVKNGKQEGSKRRR
jgi:hypothetical protein